MHHSFIVENKTFFENFLEPTVDNLPYHTPFYMLRLVIYDNRVDVTEKDLEKAVSSAAIYYFSNEIYIYYNKNNRLYFTFINFW